MGQGSCSKSFDSCVGGWIVKCILLILRGESWERWSSGAQICVGWRFDVKMRLYSNVIISLYHKLSDQGSRVLILE